METIKHALHHMDRERKVSGVGENTSSRFSVPESGSHFVASLR